MLSGVDNFASTTLFNFVAQQLSTNESNAFASNRFEGKIESQRKTELLEHALNALGASALISIGQGIRGEQSDPTLAVLLRADTPNDLMQRWQRLERYYHGKHRTRTIDSTHNLLRIEHYSTTRKNPSAGEDLLIAGLLSALLQLVGCRYLTLGIGDPNIRFIDQDHIVGEAHTPHHTSVWTIRWQSFQPSVQLVPRRPGATSVSDRLAALIASDLCKHWRVSLAAAELALSTRSLQRSLEREHTSFQAILRKVRAEQSAALLAKQSLSLAEIGYTCGFSDQAHFSREFKLRFNMAPSEFAEIDTAH
ncbi:MAG: helix-turn-helix transcriptional regulator [Pseudomonadota bacterium]